MQAIAYAEAENPKTNAYLTFSPERALAAAREVDEKNRGGRGSGSAGGRAHRGQRRYRDARP